MDISVVMVYRCRDPHLADHSIEYFLERERLLSSIYNVGFVILKMKNCILSCGKVKKVIFFGTVVSKYHSSFVILNVIVLQRLLCHFTFIFSLLLFTVSVSILPYFFLCMFVRQHIFPSHILISSNMELALASPVYWIADQNKWQFFCRCFKHYCLVLDSWSNWYI